MRTTTFALVGLFLFLSSCLGQSEQRVAVAEQALGACTNTEIPCTSDAQCARTCGVGTCEMGGYCRICAQDPGFVCRPTSNVCGAAEVCDGVGWDCPADRAAPAGQVCRSSQGVCDSQEVCNGSSEQCPNDSFASASTICRNASGTCDIAERCTGSSASCPSDSRAAAGTSCRAASGACDVAEVCDGSSTACPSNSFVAAGTQCRAATGVCDVADVCSGSSGTCADNKVAAGTECRASSGVCDSAESCNGSSSNCPNDTFLGNSTVCRVSSGACDAAERCSGSSASCPSDVLASAGTQCRAPAGACDAAETCSGSSNVCPADSFVMAGMQCRANAGACDNGAEFCSGSSAACPADSVAANGTVCRASAGVCDIAETCNGSSGACPANAFHGGSSPACRASAGPCDVAELCNGFAADCPADTLASNGTQCRAANGGCDVPEVCSGASTTCPADGGAFRAAGTTCRAANGLCDVAETCSGASAACPANGFQSAGFMCRAASGACDVADTCTGTSATCTNSYLTGGTVCRASAGICDRQEVCTGSSANCPSNSREPFGTQCRASTAPCDAAETCNGSSDNCPADVLASAGTTCRIQAGTCDIPETCNGLSSSCPSDSLQPMGALCRPTSGACDTAEFCSGGNAQCPSDGFLAGGTSCRVSAGPCDVAETCSGGSAACPSNGFLSASTICRAQSGTCDVAERCSGGSAFCPSDGSASNGTSCDADNNVCNGAASCQSGACGATSAPLNCNDNNPCTADSCDAVLGCRNVPVAPGTGCDDGLYCTTGDTCSAGTCTGSTRNCGSASEACLIMQCDESTDRCVEAPNPSGVPCVSRSTKPHMMVILDNSGTMSASTGSGTNSCNSERTRISDAKCVLSTVVSSYGDIIFGLERFQQTSSGSCTGACPSCDSGGTCPSTCSSCNAATLNCGACNPNASTPAAGTCPATGGSADQGQILTPLVDDNQASIYKWINNTCNSCAVEGSNPELTSSLNVYTPLAGSLRAARRYFEGGDPVFPSPVDSARTCTPYYVVLITDGTESCTTYTDTVAAATELRNTVVNGVRFDVRTYTIGVGIDESTPNGAFNGARLREVATAGGTTPYFASNEQSLALAFAQILEDSLLVELCNGSDDDCDSRVDEGYTLYCDQANGVTANTLCTNPGDPCDGMDNNCALGINDEVRNACGVCGPLPVEICDRVDNNCNGTIDEPPADCSCVAEPEVCDGVDNDCDGTPDDGLERACGSGVGVCTRGTQICQSGAWGVCTGTNPTSEVCNGLDDDCDGVIDGITRSCGPASVGICGPGTEVCVLGSWGACTGASLPATEYCDGVDNNCNGELDEADPSIGTACATTCGSGSIRCVNAALVCVAQNASSNMELCNLFDDDCDGRIDESVASRGACDNGGTLCVAGEERCVEGAFQCVGGSPPQSEVCDCRDNDCNNGIDDGSPCGTAGEGAQCLGEPYCQCARPCTLGEFPCPDGFACTGPTDPRPGFCVPDPCRDVRCDNLPDGTLRTCQAGQCINACDLIQCAAGQACDPRTTQCRSDDCYGFPGRCDSMSRCVAGECERDACVGVSCPNDSQFCRNGTCVESCAGVVCDEGQRCSAGQCSIDRCQSVTCSSAQTCDPDTGMCVENLCNQRPRCPENTVCEPLSGMCVRDPCLNVLCPTASTCSRGECIGSMPIDAGVGPDASTTVRVLASGAMCSASSHKVSLVTLLLVLFAGAWSIGRAHRRSRGQR